MLENNLMSHTLEYLENNYWSKPDAFPTALTEKIFNLRKKKLKDYNTEDIRLMIDQKEGLIYLVPMGLKILEQDILAEGLYYPGDLLISLLDLDYEYWRENQKNMQYFAKILNDYLITIEESNEIADEDLKSEIFNKSLTFLGRV
jgi:hypothetical protein